MNATKYALFKRGQAAVEIFCKMNDIAPPSTIQDRPCVGTAGWYIGSTKSIWCDLTQCHVPDSASWSYPGYLADLTPLGVVAHELGHHIHFQCLGAREAIKSFRSHVTEDLVSSYARTSTGEAIAEGFRVFMLNPDLLATLFPQHYEWFTACGLKSIVTQDWRTVLQDSPRHIMAVMRKLK